MTKDEIETLLLEHIRTLHGEKYGVSSHVEHLQIVLILVRWIVDFLVTKGIIKI